LRLWDRLTKSPEERLLNLIVGHAGKPGFSFSYSPEGKTLSILISEYSLEAVRVELIELGKQVDNQVRPILEHGQSSTSCTITFSKAGSMDLVTKLNEKLAAAHKEKYVLQTKPRQENKTINSFAQLLEGDAKDKLLFDYDKERGLLLVRVMDGVEPLTSGESAFLMKLGKTTTLAKGVGVLVDEKMRAMSYAKTVADLGISVLEGDLSHLLPELRNEVAQDAKKRVPEYVQALMDLRKSDRLSWVLVTGGDNKKSARLIFKNEDAKDTFIASLPAGARHVVGAAPSELKEKLAAAGIDTDACQMVMVNTEAVAADILHYCQPSKNRGGQHPGKQ
jgi:hypothetical protein